MGPSTVVGCVGTWSGAGCGRGQRLGVGVAGGLGVGRGQGTGCGERARCDQRTGGMGVVKSLSVGGVRGYCEHGQRAGCG